MAETEKNTEAKVINTLYVSEFLNNFIVSFSLALHNKSISELKEYRLLVN